MTIEGDYEPSALQWVRDQVEAYEASGGTEANTLRDTGIPVIIVTMKGVKSGKVRKIALMRVEHDGEYALIASKGGAPSNPEWYANLTAHPSEVAIQRKPRRSSAVSYTVDEGSPSAVPNVSNKGVSASAPARTGPQTQTSRKNTRLADVPLRFTGSPTRCSSRILTRLGRRVSETCDQGRRSRMDRT